jgi:hypothetical protein
MDSFNMSKRSYQGFILKMSGSWQNVEEERQTGKITEPFFEPRLASRKKKENFWRGVDQWLMCLNT